MRVEIVLPSGLSSEILLVLLYRFSFYSVLRSLDLGWKADLFDIFFGVLIERWLSTIEVLDWLCEALVFSPWFSLDFLYILRDLWTTLSFKEKPPSINISLDFLKEVLAPRLFLRNICSLPQLKYAIPSSLEFSFVFSPLSCS